MAIWQNDLSKDHTEKSPGISHGPGNNLTSGGKKASKKTSLLNFLVDIKIPILGKSEHFGQI